MAAEPRPAPAKLAHDARELLAELTDACLDLPRYRFLAAQVRALECAARRLAGEPVSFLAEVGAYFDVEIHSSVPSVSRAARRPRTASAACAPARHA